ncbi:MAG: aminotransferase class I/II-fold pyridoxal phosphate-dependent enzyme [Deltaproteobacteria bacterium]|nr:aminotransferase class I/II-fold pyridoxal phosphate-dependent enzyme [Deltaproteobacteria bacterium]
MKAVVLTAGIARRMQPLSDHLHKTLLPIGESTILGRIIDGLLALDVTDITLVTGHRADDLKTFMAERYPKLAVKTVHNARYAETNNIVSLSLALDAMTLDDDLLLIESDLLFDASVLRSLLLPGGENLALVDRYRPGLDGTVVSASGGYIDGVFPPHLQGEGFTYDDKFKTLNIYRFNKDFVRARFQPLLSCYANLIDQNCYYELVLGMLVNMQRERIRAVVVDAPWAEVDDPNDFASARFTFEPQQRAQLLERTAGGHWSVDLLDFHFIRNMHFPTDAMIAALRQALPGLVRSYGSSQGVLDEKLSFHLKCEPKRVLALHGASQIYPWLPELLGPGPVLAPWPTFGEYKRVFPQHARYDDLPGIDLQKLEAQVEHARTIVIVNPNNPTGTTLGTRWIHTLAKRHADKRFVVDESFIDFSAEESLVPLLEREPLPNVLVLKSLSKTLGAPGLRLGYAYSCDLELIAKIRAHIPIWNLSAPAEFFLELLLKFRPELARSLTQTASDREDLAARLRELPQVERVFPSGADFLLVKLRGSDPAIGAWLVQQLLARFRIYIKDVSERFAERGVWLRFAVRLPQEHQRLIEGLKAVLA